MELFKIWCEGTGRTFPVEPEQNCKTNDWQFVNSFHSSWHISTVPWFCDWRSCGFKVILFYSFSGLVPLGSTLRPGRCAGYQYVRRYLTTSAQFSKGSILLSLLNETLWMNSSITGKISCLKRIPTVHKVHLPNPEIPILIEGWEMHFRQHFSGLGRLFKIAFWVKQW